MALADVALNYIIVLHRQPNGQQNVFWFLFVHTNAHQNDFFFLFLCCLVTIVPDLFLYFSKALPGVRKFSEAQVRVFYV